MIRVAIVNTLHFNIMQPTTAVGASAGGAGGDGSRLSQEQLHRVGRAGRQLDRDVEEVISEI